MTFGQVSRRSIAKNMTNPRGIGTCRGAGGNLSVVFRVFIVDIYLAAKIDRGG